MALAKADQDRLRDEFEDMPGRVTLLFFAQALECDACPEVRQILAEITNLTDKVVVEEVNYLLERHRAERFGIDHVPAVALLSTDATGVSHDLGLRFLGVPSGFEFISLVHGVLLAGGRPPELSAETLGRLATLNHSLTLRVFTTPTCAYCPRAVNLAFEMAVASPHVTAFAIEATGFPDLVRQYEVNGVPKTIVDDRIEILGAIPEDEFVAQVLGEGDGRLGIRN